MKITVISSIHGNYDQPVPPVPQDVDCDWILVTDRPMVCDPWQVMVEPHPQLHPRLAAKIPKTRPDLYAKSDAYLWVDGSIAITSPGFVSWAIAPLERYRIAQVPHPQRQSITAEAEVSALMLKYAGLPVREQAAAHIAAGYPDGWGLWATGIIAYRSDIGPEFGDAWLAEQLRWTYQDQLSEAPVLFARHLRPADLPGGLWGNPRFVVRGHVSDL